MADPEIRSTPEKHPTVGALSRLVGRVDKFARAPFGYSNPPVEMLSDLLEIPALYRTGENIAYGSPLTIGAGQARRMTEDTTGAVGGVLNLISPAASTAKLAVKGAKAAAPRAGMLAQQLAARTQPMPLQMNIVKPKDEKQVLTRVLSKGAPLLRKGSLEETLEALKSSQKANLERQHLIENLHRYHADENPKIAEALERMYEGLEKPVDLDAAVKAYGEGFVVPGSRISFSKDIGMRSPQAQYPGLHFAAPGKEQQLQHFIELYANEFAPDRPKAFSPTMRPVLAKANKPIQLSDEAFEYPDILAKELGLTKEFRKAVDQFYSKPRDFSKIDRDVVEADIITKLLAKKNIDLGVYTNVAEGVLGPENTSFVSFGKNKLRGFAQGGAVEYDPDHIESLAQGFDAEEFASGGAVNYNQSHIDELATRFDKEM